MFAGERRRSSNIRIMQLFHELKQQFPTVPDHVITSCLSSYSQSTDPSRETDLRADLAHHLTKVQMGRPPKDELPQENMSESSDFNKNTMASSVSYCKKLEQVSMQSEEKTELQSSPKRPNYLDLSKDQGSFNIQPSERCRDVHKLLSQSVLCDKPPKSPLSSKRLAKASPQDKRPVQEDPPKKTASTPTQTTDTLNQNQNGVNLMLNVNCSMDMVQTPTPRRRTSQLSVTPSQPWLQDPVSPRSYTSVNLVLRPPCSEPQAPIDITSQNSSLTYSTSSFDCQKGLQSRLQITVGPGTSSVSSLRTRPRSSYHPTSDDVDVLPVRAGSLNNLAVDSEPPVILKQQARIERLRIELKHDKTRLVVMRKEVEELEKSPPEESFTFHEELEKQLLMEIKHLTCQCEQLGNDDFYSNFYTGQRGPTRPRPVRPAPPPPQIISQTASDIDGLRWACNMCTFLNNPYMNKCEQCEMPRILHGNRRGNVAASLPLNLPQIANNPAVLRSFSTGGAMAVSNVYTVQESISDPTVNRTLRTGAAGITRRRPLTDTQKS